MKTYRFALVLLVLPFACHSQTTTPAAATETTAPTAQAKWSDIKDLNYDQRDAFMSGLDLLQKRLDLQMAGLKAKREKLPATEDIGEFDLDMNALITARTRFTSASTDLRKANSDNWNQLKERVAAAWENAQSDYQKAAGETL